MALCTRLLSRSLRLCHVRSVFVSAARLNDAVLPRHELFAKRHIGPSDEDAQEMLKVCGAKASLTDHNAHQTHLAETVLSDLNTLGVTCETFTVEEPLQALSHICQRRGPMY